MANYETILLDLDRDTGVATLTINRPERANSINAQLGIDINAAMDALERDEAARVVVITGAGRFFCGGADLREINTAGVGGIVSPGGRDFMSHLEESPLPVIAAINGACMGGGCEIALSCDVRVMAEGAKIGLPEIQFGALPAAGGTQRLARVVGPARAKELIYSGRHISAADAERWGLVNYAVPDAQLMDRARELAAEFAQRAKYALATAKFLINRSMDTDLQTGLKIERRVIAGMATPEERAKEQERAAATQDTYRRIFKRE